MVFESLSVGLIVASVVIMHGGCGRACGRLDASASCPSSGYFRVTCNVGS